MAKSKPAQYPGWRTMTGAQRYNARMRKIFEDTYALARAQGKESPWDKPRTENKAATERDSVTQ